MVNLREKIIKARVRISRAICKKVVTEIKVIEITTSIEVIFNRQRGIRRTNAYCFEFFIRQKAIEKQIIKSKLF